MICVDNNFLVLLFHPTAKAPDDPNTGKPVERLNDRLELLKQTWKDDREKILIPSPVLSEFLIFVQEDAPKYLIAFEKSPNFDIKPFDTMAAVELAALYWKERTKLSATQKKEFDSLDTKTRLKFDRQIVAIARAHGVTTIYSDDRGVKAFANLHGIAVIGIWELPLPPEPEPNPQTSLLDLIAEIEEAQKDNESEVTIAAAAGSLGDDFDESESEIEMDDIEENQGDHQTDG